MPCVIYQQPAIEEY
jgi:hypothetical protein